MFLPGEEYFQLSEIEVYKRDNLIRIDIKPNKADLDMLKPFHQQQQQQQRPKKDLIQIKIEPTEPINERVITRSSFISSPFESKILLGRKSKDLVKLCEFKPSQKWSLLYRGTRDGFSAKSFHSKCDDKAPTLTIMKCKQTKFIFGGYTEAAWSSNEVSKSDSNAFLFSLTNKENRPCKMKTTRSDFAIGCSALFGPRFGAFGDICILNEANVAPGSWSNLGWTYAHPRYVFGTKEAREFLAGSYNFQLSEIEIYQKES